ncbi:MAG UNVERIFIED_CONTAM: hypothetical protein LVT10_25500 [Anaerolineae bacterium]
MRSRSLSAEVIVVENAAQSRTAAVTEHYSETHPYVKLLVVKTRGKGLAVKAGMLLAQGEIASCVMLIFRCQLTSWINSSPPTCNPTMSF